MEEALIRLRNCEHPTTNTEQPTSNWCRTFSLGVRCWMLVVGCFPSEDKHGCKKHWERDPTVHDGHSPAAPPPVICPRCECADDGVRFDPKNPAHVQAD